MRIGFPVFAFQATAHSLLLPFRGVRAESRDRRGVLIRPAYLPSSVERNDEVSVVFFDNPRQMLAKDRSRDTRRQRLANVSYRFLAWFGLLMN
uniref:Putative secreted protein n=1 Tax=Anopheles marajoara TaxID=58244 RepID=A0A2M4C9S7_9DIPT